MGSIKPAPYLPRIVDEQLDRYLEIFGAVEVRGPKWCGKTWTSRMHGRSIAYLDDQGTMARAKADPSLVLAGQRPRVIDEWQLVPGLWDAVRHAVDETGGERGCWILTGSSTPAKDAVHHSGAGRLGMVTMAPMSLFESGESTGAVSLRGLFEGEFSPCAAEADSRELVELVCRGGFPDAIRGSAQDSLVRMGDYLRSVYEQSFQRLGKSGTIAQRLVTSLARCLGQSVTLATLNRDANGPERGETIASSKTIAEYLEALSSLYLLTRVPGWAPPIRDPRRVRTKERRYFADPSLAVAALGTSPDALLEDWQTFGLLFENLCIRDLEVYARALSWAALDPVRYYHDDSDLEVDAVVERPDGSWGAFEIKVSEDKVPGALEQLRRLRSKLCDNPRARMRAPSFLGVLVGIGKYAYQAEEGLYVIPIRTLGP